MCRLFTENSEIVCNSKSDEWVPGRWSIGVKDPSRTPSCVSCYLLHHTPSASCPSFLISQCRVSQNMNDCSYFQFWYTHAHPLFTYFSIIAVTSEALFLSSPSLSMISRTSWSRRGLFSQTTIRFPPHTWNGKLWMLLLVILQVLCSAPNQHFESSSPGDSTQTSHPLSNTHCSKANSFCRQSILLSWSHHRR